MCLWYRDLMATYFDVSIHMPDGNTTEFPDPWPVSRLNDYLEALSANVTLPPETDSAGEAKVTYTTPGDSTVKWTPTRNGPSDG